MNAPIGAPRSALRESRRPGAPSPPPTTLPPSRFPLPGTATATAFRGPASPSFARAEEAVRTHNTHASLRTAPSLPASVLRLRPPASLLTLSARHFSPVAPTTSLFSPSTSPSSATLPVPMLPPFFVLPPLLPCKSLVQQRQHLGHVEPDVLQIEVVLPLALHLEQVVELEIQLEQASRSALGRR